MEVKASVQMRAVCLLRKHGIRGNKFLQTIAYRAAKRELTEAEALKTIEVIKGRVSV